MKYVYQYGPAHASFMYAQGGQDTSLHGGGIAGGGGFTWRGLSVDGVYTKENSATRAAAPLSAAQVDLLGQNKTSSGGSDLSGFSIDKSLAVQGVDISAWTIGARYSFDLGGYGGWKDGGCGLKDDCSGAKLTFFTGYQRSNTSNPTDRINVGDTIQNGYRVAFVDNNAYTTDRVLQTFWAGAKYETGPWSLTGAYYLLDQNSFIAQNHNCAFKSAAVTVGQKFGSNCSGDINMGSFLVDYAFTKHFDVYSGVNYSTADGGLSSGFLQTDSFLFMSGMRLRF